jgi:hypothetical protein
MTRFFIAFGSSEGHLFYYDTGGAECPVKAVVEVVL